MPNEMYEKGLKIRTEVLGEEYVNRAIKGATDFNIVGERCGDAKA
jgi:4-carboxymuconolactone decarboxylase